MIDIDNIKVALDVMNVSDENKLIILQDCETLHDFRKFLSLKYSIPLSDVESKIQNYIHSRINMSDINGVDAAIEVSYQYAIYEGFPYPDKLKESITRLNKMLMII